MGVFRRPAAAHRRREGAGPEIQMIVCDEPAGALDLSNQKTSSTCSSRSADHRVRLPLHQPRPGGGTRDEPSDRGGLRAGSLNIAEAAGLTRPACCTTIRTSRLSSWRSGNSGTPSSHSAAAREAALRITECHAALPARSPRAPRPCLAAALPVLRSRLGDLLRHPRHVLRTDGMRPRTLGPSGPQIGVCINLIILRKISNGSV